MNFEDLGKNYPILVLPIPPHPKKSISYIIQRKKSNVINLGLFNSWMDFG